MTKNPKISIIIPTFNRATMLMRAIESITQQEFINYEIVIVDNFSTDNTEKNIKELNNKKIKFIQFKNNGNIAASRNVGLKNSIGEWVAFLDSDDWWHRTKLLEVERYLTDEYDFLYHKLQAVKITDNNLIYSKILYSKKLKKPIIEDLLLSGNVINNSSVIVKSSILKKIGGISEDRNFIYAEDYHTWLRVAEKTEKFFYIPKVLGYYLIHDGNLQFRDMSKPTLNIVNQFIHLVNSEKQNKIIANLSFMSAKFNFIKKDYDIALKKFISHIIYLNTLDKLKSFFFIINIVLLKLFKKFN